MIKKIYPFWKSYTEIWGSFSTDEDKMQDIDHLVTMCAYNDGQSILHKSIFYLNDRDSFEYTWVREHIKNSIYFS